MAWYSFRQTNSGGVFDYDANSGISVNVFIEADTPEQANERAESIGIYFDDDYDVDCSCCGQRWSRVYFNEDVQPPTENEPITIGYLRKWMDEGEPESFVHPKDRPFYGAHKTVIDTIE